MSDEERDVDAIAHRQHHRHRIERRQVLGQRVREGEGQRRERDEKDADAAGARCSASRGNSIRVTLSRAGLVGMRAVGTHLCGTRSQSVALSVTPRRAPRRSSPAWRAEEVVAFELLAVGEVVVEAAAWSRSA